MAEPNTSEDFNAAADRARRVVEAHSTDLVPTGNAPAETVRAGYGTQLADVKRTAEALRAANVLREAQLRAALDEQIRAMNEVMAPLLKLQKQLEEGLWTVKLYLGTEEQIETVVDGRPAPAGTPITLRQLVLAMDEECLVAAEDGGIDARRVNDFAVWLREDPRHLDQVMPEQKGVVILVPSRQSRDYGDRWMNQAMAQANKTSHWLIRNGERVYLMTTDITVGDRMLPTRTEFEEFFYDIERRGDNRGQKIPLVPGSEAWVRAEQAAGFRQRHYMRIMLILQGLADRTTIFQPLAEPVNFMSLAAQDAGQVVIINEIDNVLGSGRPSFRSWQRDLNAQLSPGMRIIGRFDGQEWHDANANERDRWRHSRLHPQRASSPASGTVHTITRRAPDNGLVFPYDRSDQVIDTSYGGYAEGPAKVRASCTIYPDRDRFILPFDLVTLDELHTYLHARTERHDYITMIPVIKAAIAAKLAEAEAEAPFRQLIAGRIALGNGLDVAEVEASMQALVDWWKLSNLHNRALVSDPDTEAKAITAIEREWHLRRAEAARGGEIPHFEQANVEQIRASVPDAICVGRRRGDGVYVAYVPADDGNVWVHEHRFHVPTGSRGRFRHGEIRQWVLAPRRTVDALTILWADDRWAGWNHRASRSEHLTGPEVEELTQRMHDIASGYGPVIAVTYQALPNISWGSDGRTFYAYSWDQDKVDVWSKVGDTLLRDPADVMCPVSGSWRRDQSGKPSLAQYGRHRGHRWGQYNTGDVGTPWHPAGLPTAERLIWSDPEQLARVDEMWTEINRREAARKTAAEKVRRLHLSLSARAEKILEQQQYQRFLEDYPGATDLWEGHRKTLRIEFRSPHYLYEALGDLVKQDVDLHGLTVAEAVALTGSAQRVVLPDYLAEMMLIDPTTDNPTE